MSRKYWKIIADSQRHLERMVGIVSKIGEHSITIVGIALLASSRNQKASLGGSTAGLIESPVQRR
jgi:hypothetical protein